MMKDLIFVVGILLIGLFLGLTMGDVFFEGSTDCIPYEVTHLFFKVGTIDAEGNEVWSDVALDKSMYYDVVDDTSGYKKVYFHSRPNLTNKYGLFGFYTCSPKIQR